MFRLVNMRFTFPPWFMRLLNILSTRSGFFAWLEFFWLLFLWTVAVLLALAMLIMLRLLAQPKQHQADTLRGRQLSSSTFTKITIQQCRALIILIKKCYAGIISNKITQCRNMARTLHIIHIIPLLLSSLMWYINVEGGWWKRQERKVF